MAGPAQAKGPKFQPVELAFVKAKNKTLWKE